MTGRASWNVDDYGPEGIRAQVEERLGRTLENGAAPEPKGYADHMGIHEQKQPGLFHVGIPVPVGLVRGEQLIQIADLDGASGRFLPFRYGFCAAAQA